MVDGQAGSDRSTAAAELLAACRAGQAATRAEAFQLLGRQLYRVLWPRVQSDPRLAALAEDCVQDALVKVWRALEAGQGPEHPERFVSWAARIAVNTLVSELRRLDPGAAVTRPKRVRLRSQVSLDELAAPDEGPGRELPAGDPALDEQAARQELVALLAEIQRHPAVSVQSRIVLLRGYLEEWDDDELARHLGTTRANVHVIRCRDLAKLRADAVYMARLTEITGAAPSSPVKGPGPDRRLAAEVNDGEG
jgi:RNA polymerase sigma factor (sigma-70 family)